MPGLSLIPPSGGGADEEQVNALGERVTDLENAIGSIGPMVLLETDETEPDEETTVGAVVLQKAGDGGGVQPVHVLGYWAGPPAPLPETRVERVSIQTVVLPPTAVQIDRVSIQAVVLPA